MWIVLEPLTLHHLSPYYTVLVPIGETLSALIWHSPNILAVYQGETFALPSGSLHRLRLVGAEEPVVKRAALTWSGE